MSKCYDENKKNEMKGRKGFKMKKVILTVGLFLSPILSESMFPEDAFIQKPKEQNKNKSTYQIYHAKIRKDKTNTDVYVHLRTFKVRSTSEEQTFAVIKITRKYKYKKEISIKVGLFRLLPADGGRYHWSLLFTRDGILESSKDIVYTSTSTKINKGRKKMQLLKANLSCNIKDLLPNKIVLQQVVSSHHEVWMPFPFNAFVQKRSKRDQIGYIQEGEFYSGRGFSQEGDFILQKMTPYVTTLRPKVASLFTSSGWDISLEAESIALAFQNKSSWKNHKTILFVDNEGGDDICFKNAVFYNLHEPRD